MCPNDVTQVGARCRRQIVEDRAVDRPERMARRPIDHTPVILWCLWYRLVHAKPGDEHRRRATRTRCVERDPFAIGRDPSVRDRLLRTRQHIALVSAHAIEQPDRVEASTETFDEDEALIDPLARSPAAVISQ